jgi:hypothetical protein
LGVLLPPEFDPPQPLSTRAVDALTAAQPSRRFFIG